MVRKAGQAECRQFASAHLALFSALNLVGHCQVAVDRASALPIPAIGRLDVPCAVDTASA